MKTKLIVSILLTILIIGIYTVSVSADPPDKLNCVTIQDGTLTYSAGHYLFPQPLMVGYDDYGYNYQAHMFNGSFANVYLGRDGFPPFTGDAEAYLDAYPAAGSKWYWPYHDVQLVMKWNHSWLANVDCDFDGALDRHYGFASYIGSGAWETNHQFGSYEVDGVVCEWDYFTKIIAAPGDASLIGMMWFNPEGVEIGPVIWSEFATIEDVLNDPCAGIEGIQYLSPDHPGFGGW